MTDATTPAAGTTPPLTEAQTALADVGIALAEANTFAPLLPPKAQLVLAGVNAAFQAVSNAAASGVDVTDEALQTLFDKYAANDADDLQAQAEDAARPKP